MGFTFLFQNFLNQRFFILLESTDRAGLFKLCDYLAIIHGTIRDWIIIMAMAIKQMCF